MDLTVDKDIQHILLELETLLKEKKSSSTVLEKEDYRNVQTLFQNKGSASDIWSWSTAALDCDSVSVDENKDDKSILSRFRFLLYNLIHILSSTKLLPSQEVANNAFNMILTLIYRENILNVSFIYCFLFRASSSLLKEFCKRESSYICSTDMLSESLSHTRNSAISARNQRLNFFFSLKGSHVLTMVYKRLLNALCSYREDFVDSVVHMPMNEWCKPLYLVLVLHHCSLIAEDKLQLLPTLNTLLQEYEESSDAAIYSVACQKRKHLSVVNWCLQYQPDLNIQMSLKLLQDHSILYAIQSLVSLHKLPYQNILDILLHKDIKDNHTVNISYAFTYYGYFIMLLSFNAIAAGIEMEKSVCVWREKKCRREPVCKVHETDQHSYEVDVNSCKRFYKIHVVRLLEKIIDIFSKISNICFCVEILENLFSLLFISHASFSDEACSNSSWDELETNSPSSLKLDMDKFPSVSSVISSTEHMFHGRVTELKVPGTTRTTDALKEIRAREALDKNIRLYAYGEKKRSSPGTDRQKRPNIFDREAYFNCSSSFNPLSCSTSSDFSSSSSVEDFSNCGYLMSVLVVWDHLLLLKELIISCKVKQEHYIESECLIQLSTEERISQRIQDLEARVTDALWKLKVLMPKYQNRTLGSESEISLYMNETLLETISPQVKYDGLDNNSGKCKSEVKLSICTNKCSQKNWGIINFLLSSPHNLLTIALIQNNLEGAHEVVQRHLIQNCREKQELVLMSCLQENIPNIEAICTMQRNKNCLNTVTERSEDKSVRKIETNACDISVSCLIDQTLNLFMLEDPEINDKDGAFLGNESELCIQTLPKLILIDIALTAQLSMESVLKLLAVAFSHRDTAYQGHYCKSYLYLHVQSYLKTPSQLMNLFPVLQELAEGDSLPFISDSAVPHVWNPTTIFLSKWPLKVDSLKLGMELWLSLIACIFDFISNYNIKKKYLKNRQTCSDLSICYDYILQVLLVCQTEGRNYLKVPIVNIRKSLDYLHYFLNYLQLLYSTVTEYKTIHLSETAAVSKDLFFLLNKRPITLIGDLLFVSNVNPVNLETASAHMELDVMAVIVKYVFSEVSRKFDSVKIPTYNKTCSLSFDTFGCCLIDGHYILNAGKLSGTNPVHGDFVTTNLLSALLDRLQDVHCENNALRGELVLSYETAEHFLTDPQIRSILLETCEIGYADIRKLEPGRDSLVFFVNLANLMFIHALLVNSLIFPSTDNRLGIFSRSSLEIYLSLKFVGYIVGQLGFISLYDILFGILKLPVMYDDKVQSAASHTMQEDKDSNEKTSLFSQLEDLLLEIPPEILFVVSHIRNPSPKINVYFPDSFQDGLSIAVSSYISRFIAQYPVKDAAGNPFLFYYIFQHKDDFESALTKLLNYAYDANIFVDWLKKLGHKKYFSDTSVQIDGETCVQLRINYSAEDNINHQQPFHAAQATSNKAFSVSTREKIVVTADITKYVSSSCPVIAVFIEKYFGIPSDTNEQIQSTVSDKCYSVEFLVNWFSLSEAQCLSKCCADIILHLFHEPDYSVIICETEKALLTIPQENIAVNLAHTKYLNLITYLSELPSSALWNTFHLNYIRDQVFVYLSQGADINENSYQFLYLIRDGRLRINFISNLYKNWPIEASIDCLQFVLADSFLSISQQEWTIQKLNQMEVYAELLHATEENMGNVFLMQPHQVLKVLSEHKQHGLFVKFIMCHNLEDQYYYQMLRSSLLDCLDNGYPNLSGAKQILDGIPAEILANLLFDILQQIHVYSTRSYLIDIYFQKNCPEAAVSITVENTFSLRQELMGLILVEDVAPKYFNRIQLFPLICKPYLILEQWIMNLKFDNVSKALDHISHHLDAIPALQSYKLEHLSWNQFNWMIEKYAAKALEMAGIQVNVQHRFSITDTVEQYAIPLSVPKKSEWQLNSSVTICPVCSKMAFSLFCRRHHCRRCGRVVCAACSKHRFMVEGYSTQVRVCTYCFRNLLPQSLEEPAGNQLQRYFQFSATAYGSASQSKGSCSSESGWHFTTDQNQIRSVREEFSYDFAPSLSLCLTILSFHKDDKRAAICILDLCKKLFLLSFDALSVKFSEVDVNFVLKMIDTLLSTAKVRFSKVMDDNGISLCEYYSQWVDLLLLLLNAKCISLIPSPCLINMIRIGELQQCRIANSSVKPLLLQQNIENEHMFLQVLRDNLVKSEMWHLALDVSTKAGFDTAGVWGALAMASLKAGDFAAARDHFSKLLTKRKDKNVTVKCSLLYEIVSYLESQPQAFKHSNCEAVSNSSVPGESSDSTYALIVTQTLKNLSLIVNGALIDDNVDGSSNNSLLPECSLDPILYQECVYYICLYGCHRMYLQFLLRHSLVRAAVKYSQQVELQADIFAEEIVLPMFRRGQFSDLWNVITEVDPHEKWIPSLILMSCKWLERHKFLHCLLEIQKVLNDWLRSAITLIHLYMQSADSFTELIQRKHYLSEASLHLQAYLDVIPLNENLAKHQTAIGMAGLCMHSSSWAVNQQINLCSFQGDVVQYLGEVERKTGSLKPFLEHVCKLGQLEKSCKLPGIKPKIPTVFQKEERLLVSVVTVCCGGSVTKGLSLIYRLVEINAIHPKDLLSVSLKVLAMAGNHKDLPVLVDGILEWGLIPDSQIKAILWPTIIWAGQNAPESVMRNLIKFLTNTSDKMNAYVEAGHLKLAYFQITDNGQKEDFERLLEMAKVKQDQAVIYNCNKRLQNYRATI